MIFHVGQLVQVFRSDLAYSIGSERKLTPMWSNPRRVTKHLVNSYKLETLDGAKLEGEFSARRLREFIPREGTELAEAQRVHMDRVNKEEAERAKREKEEVESLRRKENEGGMAEIVANHRMADIVGPGFFYEGNGDEEENEEENEEEIEGEGIAERVVRRRGHRH